MAKTISQRISLEGSEDIRKKLEQLGKTGEQAFKQIQDAAKKPITDPAQIQRTQQAIDQLVQAGTRLGQQFQALTNSTRQFGAEGEKAAAQVTAGLNQTNQAAQAVGTGIEQSVTKLGAVIGFIAGVVQAATNKFIALIQQLASALSPGAATKGAVETATKISDAAEKIKVTTAELVNFRKAADEAGLSNDDLVKSLEKAGGVLDKAKGGAAELGKGVSELSTFSNNGTVTLQRFNDTATDLTSAASRAATELAKLGISTRAAAMPDGIGRFRQLADEIRRIPDAARRAAAGTAVFGKDWEKVVEILHTGQRDIDNTTRSLAEMGRTNRQMSAEQVDAANKLGITWKDLQEAIRATKDLIGSLFVGGAQQRADWLVKLVDGSRELLRTWAALGEQKKQAFLEGLGESPTELLFKTLIALGQQLAGIWRDILVPAGNALMNIFKQISGQFEGVSKSQVAAFFITATAAAIGLAVALKGIQIVLAPLALLFTPFAGILIAAGAAAVLFWDQIKAGASTAAELIPNSLHTIAVAFQNLFAGNFSLFWEQFSRGATMALETIIKTLQQTEGVFGDFVRAITGGPIQTPWVQELVAGLKQIASGFAQVGKDLPGAIVLAVKTIIGAFIVLGEAAQRVADVINAVFGTKLTGTDIGVLVILGQITGAFSILSGVILTVVGTVAGLVAIFGGPFVAAIAAVIAAVVILATQFPQAWEAIKAAFVGFLQAFVAGCQIIAAGATALWEGIKAGATALWEFLKPFGGLDKAVAQIFNNMVQGVIAAWDAIKNAGFAAFEAIKSVVSDLIGLIGSALVNAIDTAIQKLLNLIGLGRDVGQPVTGGGSGSTGSWAGGGRVGGRGTGTSDSNLAWVSRGEHIMPARAVRQPGVLAFLEALRRSGGNLSRVLDGMGRFAMGGLALPSFAEGGLAGMSNVTIQFPGLPAIGGLRASSDVVDELRKAAVMAQVRSGGRKPSRYS